MTRVVLEPKRPRALFSLPLEGERPPMVYSDLGFLKWNVQGSGLSLETGGSLWDIPGSVFIRIGSQPDGRENYGGIIKWGNLNYFDGQHVEISYQLELHVSQRIHDQIVRLLELGRPPTLHVYVGCYSDKERIEQPEQRAISDSGGLWRNVKFDWVNIEWCEFRTDLGSLEPDETGDMPSNPERYLGVTKADVHALHNTVGDIKKIVDGIRWLGWVVLFLLVVLIARR